MVVVWSLKLGWSANKHVLNRYFVLQLAVDIFVRVLSIQCVTLRLSRDHRLGISTCILITAGKHPISRVQVLRFRWLDGIFPEQLRAQLRNEIVLKLNDQAMYERPEFPYIQICGPHSHVFCFVRRRFIRQKENHAIGCALIAEERHVLRRWNMTKWVLLFSQ